jgi:UDP-glucuronate decarboxylase
MPLPSDDPKQRKPDISLARATLDWTPATALDQGLRRTIDYFERMMSAKSVDALPKAL